MYKLHRLRQEFGQCQASARYPAATWPEAEGMGVRSPFGASECSGVILVRLNGHICVSFRTKTSHVLFCLLGRKLPRGPLWTRQIILIRHHVGAFAQK